MRNIARAAAVVLALLPLSVFAQEATLPVPSNVTLEGMPPIPVALAEALASYGSARQAILLAWHPTRRQVLISTRFGNVPQIHAVSGPGMDRAQLTFFREGVQRGSAAYEPVHGDYFVFTKDAGGGTEALQLFRYDVATGRATMITDGKSRYGSPAWSHKAGLIAFECSRRNGKDRDLYVMNPLEPGSLKMVAQTEGSWSVSAWSPDDSELIAMSAVTNEEKHLWRVKVATGEKTLLTEGDKARWDMAQYSPDGRSLYGLSNRGGDTLRIWRTDVASVKWTPLTKEDEGVESFALSPDGRTLAVTFDSTTSSRLELIDAATSAVRLAPKLPAGQLLGAPQWRPGGGEVAFSLWSLRTYGDVYSVNVKSGAVERWTSSELGPFNPESLPEPEIIKWKSFDGVEMSAVLYRPPARFTGPRPVIINIHGGPSGATARERPRFQGRSAYFLNELGIAMLMPNVRGSFGFGKDFERLDDGPLRENAVKDIGTLLDWIGKQPFLDKNRIAVTGASYGGYMTYAVAAMYLRSHSLRDGSIRHLGLHVLPPDDRTAAAVEPARGIRRRDGSADGRRPQADLAGDQRLEDPRSAHDRPRGPGHARPDRPGKGNGQRRPGQRSTGVDGVLRRRGSLHVQERREQRHLFLRVDDVRAEVPADRNRWNRTVGSSLAF